MNRILLLLDDRENQRLLRDALSSAYEVITPESDAALEDAFDLCILDGPALERLWQRVKARKGAEEPMAECKKVEDALQESEARMRFAMETSHIGAWDLDLVNHTAYRSLEHDRIFGYAELLPVWTYEMFLDHVLPEDRTLVAGKYQHAIDTQSDWNFECRIRRADGEVHWIWAAGRHQFDASGAARRMAGIVQDITERKLAEQEIKTLNAELEQRVAMRTAQLEAANEELEAFSYSVSHDLRAPLRIIDGFSRALSKDYQDKLGDDGKADINWIRESVLKMGRLIDDLLQLSRVGRTEPHFMHVNLSALAQSILDELRKEEPERQVRVVIQPEQIACADAGLLHIALENLLSNAWKFTGKVPDACIEFGARDIGGERVYFVKDNGAGFNMAYVDRLFTPFERLHNETEFPGMGIGLAIVRRIITMHGGRVWAEGEVEQGATFSFTLHPEGVCL